MFRKSIDYLQKRGFIHQGAYAYRKYALLATHIFIEKTTAHGLHCKEHIGKKNRKGKTMTENTNSEALVQIDALKESINQMDSAPYRSTFGGKRR